MDAVRASFPPPPPQAPSPPSPQAPPPPPQHLGVQPGVAAGLRTTGAGGRSGRLCPPVLSVRRRRLAGAEGLRGPGWMLFPALPRRADWPATGGRIGLASIRCREVGPGAERYRRPDRACVGPVPRGRAWCRTAMGARIGPGAGPVSTGRAWRRALPSAGSARRRPSAQRSGLAPDRYRRPARLGAGPGS